MKLHPIIHNHTGILWCGHAAMATITGRSTKDCLPYLKQSAKELSLHGKGITRRLKGIYPEEITRALMYFGFDCKKIHSSKLYESLPDNSLLDHVKSLMSINLYLAVIPNHFVVFQQNTIVDNSNCAGIHIEAYKRNHQPVLVIWQVSELQAKDL